MTSWHWHQPAVDFCEEYGIPMEIVEAAAEHPTSSSTDPMSVEKGYTVLDRRRGDLTAVVGLLNPSQPSILYVRLHLPLSVKGQGSTTPGGAGGEGRPRTLRGVKAAIVRDGYSIVSGGAHDKVVDSQGSFLVSLPRTPSDHRTLANVWATYLRARDRAVVRARVADGSLLRGTMSA